MKVKILGSVTAAGILLTGCASRNMISTSKEAQEKYIFITCSDIEVPARSGAHSYDLPIKSCPAYK